MRSGGWLVLVVSLLFATAAGAAKKTDYSAIDRLIADVSMGQLSIMGTSSPIEIQQRGQKTKADLESHIDAALAVAKKKPDLLKATKEYYIAATSYFDNAAPTNLIDKANTERAKKAMEERQTALELELKLVQ